MGGKRANVGVNLHLARRVGGCVIWLHVDPHDLSLRRLGWFGGGPGEPLPPLGDRAIRHTKADATGYKAERPNHRVLPKGRFEWVEAIKDLFDLLFAPDAGNASAPGIHTAP
jgi:hypothetical protein